MSALHDQLRRIIALTSMAALLLGVFEHESLLFQGANALANHSADASAAHKAGYDHGAFCSVDRDGASEGTFRSEGNSLCVVPEIQPRFVWRLTSPRLSPGPAPLPLHLRRQSRARVSGIRALRL